MRCKHGLKLLLLPFPIFPRNVSSMQAAGMFRIHVSIPINYAVFHSTDLNVFQ